MNMIGRCSRWKKCKAGKNPKIGCYGCGFKHFENILNENKENKMLQFLAEKFFDLCSERQNRGGRIALDKPINELLIKEIQELNELNIEDLTLTINGEEVNFKVKCDGKFEYNKIYFFYEVKGLGEGSNDILSAITAAQLLKEAIGSNYHYYYIGITRNNSNNAFRNKKKSKIYPYVKWAENKGFLKFYSIVDIQELVNEIKQVINKKES